MAKWPYMNKNVSDYHRRCCPNILVPSIEPAGVRQSHHNTIINEYNAFISRSKLGYDEDLRPKHIHDFKCAERSEYYSGFQQYVDLPQVMDSKPQKMCIPVKEYEGDNFKKESSLISDNQSMDWNNYHRLNVIHNFIDDLERDFPSICTSDVIGQSLEGRDLKILKISNSDANNDCVWIDAGIHAREWIGPAVNTFVANHIARNFNKLPNNITNKDWYFLPVINPDGYEYSHTKDRMWRKNRAWYGGKCVGVDLNRNFSFGYGGKGSSENPSHAFYRGPEPFSEPESCAVRDMLSYSGLKFKVYITLHSYGELVIFPFSFRQDLCPDYVRLLEGATVMSKAIYDTNGAIYKVGTSKDVLYGAAGTSYDYSYGEAGIPYAYLIELRSKKHKFALPKQEIEETGNEILNCVKALMKFVDNYTFNKIEAKPEDNNYHSKVEIECERSLIKILKRKDDKKWGLKNVLRGETDIHNTCCSNCEAHRRPINIWIEENSTMDIMVEGPRASSVAGMLHEREIPYSIAIGDVGAMLEREQGTSLTRNVRRNSGTQRQVMDWKNYHRLDTIYAFMDNLVVEYPYLCTVKVIGKSAEGRDLKMLTISNGTDTNAGVWLDGSIHPREWISAAVVTYIADRLVRTFHEQPDSVTNKDWYILPVLNPDGYEYTHTHDRMWRKNRARYGECIGVDLNRNFSYGWGEKGEEGSSDDPGNIFFRGPKPFSEPETAAVRQVISESKTPFKVFLSFHSYGEVIIFPWGYTSEPCPEYVELLEGGTAMAKAIHAASGNTYRVGSTKDLMYYAAGTSTDWSYGCANITYSYMIELKGKKHRFLLPKEEIISTAVEVFAGVLRLMDFVDGKSRSTSSCICP